MKKLTILITALVLLLSACISENISESGNCSSFSSSFESDNTESNSSFASSFVDNGSSIWFESSDISTESSDASSESDDLEFVNYELIDDSLYSVQAIYTDKLRVDGIFPYTNEYTSYKDFYSVQNHKEGISLDEVYNIDRAVGDYPSYRQWVKKYNEEFFDKYDLIVVIAESTSNEPPAIGTVYKSNKGRITIYLDNYDPWSEQKQVYHIFIEVPKGLFDNMWSVGARDIKDFDINSIRGSRNHIFNQ